MRHSTADEPVIVGHIQKSNYEIIQVIKKRLNGSEYIHAPVFCIGGSKSEKGLCLTSEQWDALYELVQQAKLVEIPKPTRRRPAMRKVSDEVQTTVSPKPPAKDVSATG